MDIPLAILSVLAVWCLWGYMLIPVMIGNQREYRSYLKAQVDGEAEYQARMKLKHPDEYAGWERENAQRIERGEAPRESFCPTKADPRDDTRQSGYWGW